MALELDETAESSAQAEEEQNAVNEAIVNATRGGSESEGITEKTAEEEKSEAEKAEVDKGEAKEAEEKKPEVKEEPQLAPTEEQEIKKLVDQFKGDPQKLAKALHHRGLLDSRQQDELGNLRKETLDYRNLQQQIRDNPEGVIAKIQEMTQAQKKEETESVLERAIEDPKVLEDFIDRRVDEKMGKRDKKVQSEKDLKDTFSDWDQVKPQVESLEQAILLDKFPNPREILYYAVKGFHGDKMLADAKSEARKEDEAALAKKMEGQVEKQGVVTSEKESEKDDTEVFQDVLINLKR